MPEVVVVATLVTMNSFGSGGDERRADRRYKVKFGVHVAREDAPEAEGEVTELSAGGCFITTGEEVSEGDLVKLRLDLSGHGDLTIWGNVVFRVRDTGFGVSFGAFSQGGAREKLMDLLNGNP
jgi:hypothetical protein